ncbi:hypothetical protein HDU85_006354 [Gaertneriomyces sp. JEL0708]|nr:hypothetical protein HDU85_006354 [Gaertneriomyces sp. JEL0708]
MPESNQQGTSRQVASGANAPVAAHGGAVRLVSAEDAKRKMEQIATGRRTRARAGADTGRIKVAFVGDSGIGKTSMILQMMRTSDIISTDPILPSKSEASPLGPTSLTIQEFRASTIPPLSLDISEDRFNLSFIDTPGYGSTLDALSVIRPVVAYHVAQFQRTDQAFTREATPLQLMRFLSAPTGAHTHIDVAAYCMLHRITGVDVHYLKRLSKVVSVVPVVIRSDTMTVDEAFAVKREIIEVLYREGIETFTTGLSKDELLALASAKVAGAPPYVVSARAPKPTSADGRVEYEGRKVLNEIETFKDTVLFLHTDELRRGTADRFVRWRSAGSPKDID